MKEMGSWADVEGMLFQPVLNLSRDRGCRRVLDRYLSDVQGVFLLVVFGVSIFYGVAGFGGREGFEMRMTT